MINIKLISYTETPPSGPIVIDLKIAHGSNYKNIAFITPGFIYMKLY